MTDKEVQQVQVELARVAEKLAACIAWRDVAQHESERQEAQAQFNSWKAEEQRWLKKLGG